MSNIFVLDFYTETYVYEIDLFWDHKTEKLGLLRPTKITSLWVGKDIHKLDQAVMVRRDALKHWYENDEGDNCFELATPHKATFHVTAGRHKFHIEVMQKACRSYSKSPVRIVMTETDGEESDLLVGSDFSNIEACLSAIKVFQD